MKIAFVIQRYGAEVLGGSEHLCRLVAERLCTNHDLDLFTADARNFFAYHLSRGFAAGVGKQHENKKEVRHELEHVELDLGCECAQGATSGRVSSLP